MELPDKLHARKQTLRDVVGIFFLKKKIFFYVFFGVIVSAMLMSFLLPPVYMVSSKLVVKPQMSKPLMFDQEASRLNLYNKVDEQTLNTAIYLLTTQEVLREVVVKHGMADPNDPREIIEKSNELRGRINAEPMTMSNIINVTYKGRDAEKITDELDTILDVFIRRYIQVTQSTEGRLEFFANQTAEFRYKFSELNKELANLRKSMGVVEPVQQKETNMHLLNDLKVERLKIMSIKSETQGKMDIMYTALDQFKQKGRLNGLSGDILTNFPALVEMEKSLTQLIINRQRARSDFAAGSKPVVDTENQYENMKTQIHEHLHQGLAFLEAEIGSHDRSIKMLEDEVDNLNGENAKLSEDVMRLEQLEHEYKLTQDNYSMYAVKQEEARINMEKDQAQFANVSVASPPVVPSSPWFPKRGQIIALSFPFGLVMAIAITAMSFGIDQRVWSPADLAAKTRITYLGSLDKISDPNKRGRILGRGKAKGRNAA